MASSILCNGGYVHGGGVLRGAPSTASVPAIQFRAFAASKTPALSFHRRGHHVLCSPLRAGKVIGVVKLALTAGKASPAPPVGPALGSKGINIMNFCKQYNSATASKVGSVVPVEITIYQDKSFTFVLKTPPTSALLKQAAGLKKASANPVSNPQGTITAAQLKEIAEAKLPDMNCRDLASAMSQVQGTARNMGITVKD